MVCWKEIFDKHSTTTWPTAIYLNGKRIGTDHHQIDTKSGTAGQAGLAKFVDI